MIEKSKYLVYNKEKDILNLNPAENTLIGNLSRLPNIKFKQLIIDHLSGDDWEEAYERLDEIFTYYFTSRSSTVSIHVFSGRVDELNQLFEILAEIKDSKLPSRQSRTTYGKYTQAQIALSIFYKQRAGTIEDWHDGEKRKELEKLAQKHGGSPATLIKAYNYFVLKGRVPNRQRFISKKENRLALEKLLVGDPKALVEMAREAIQSR